MGKIKIICAIVIILIAFFTLAVPVATTYAHCVMVNGLTQGTADTVKFADRHNTANSLIILSERLLMYVSPVLVLAVCVIGLIKYQEFHMLRLGIGLLVGYAAGELLGLIHAVTVNWVNADSWMYAIYSIIGSAIIWVVCTVIFFILKQNKKKKVTG